MKREYLYNIIMTFTISGLGFIINKYFALYLGTYNLGIMKLFTQLLAYLNLVDIGLASASTYALYKPLSNKNYKEVSIIISTISSLYNKIFIFILGVGIIITPIIPYSIKNIEGNYSNLYIYWILYVIGTAINYTFIKYNILLTANQKFIKVRIIESFSEITVRIIQLFVIIKYQSFCWFIVLIVLKSLIQYVFFRVYFLKEYKMIYKTIERDTSIYKNLKNLFWHKLAGLFVFNTDMILISKFISIEIVGIYASYQMIIQMILSIFNIFYSVLRPRIGKFIANNDKETIFKYFRKINIISLFFSLFFSLVTYRVISDFIKLWINESFILSKYTVILIIVNLFIFCFRGVLDIFKEGSGFFDDIHLPISESIINFVFSIILVNFIGLNGVILGTIISNITIICIARPILVFKRCFMQDVKKYLQLYIKYLLMIIISIIISNIIFNFFLPDFTINSWLSWIKISMIYSIITLLILVPIFIIDADFRKVLKEIKNE